VSRSSRALRGTSGAGHPYSCLLPVLSRSVFLAHMPGHSDAAPSAPEGTLRNGVSGQACENRWVASGTGGQTCPGVGSNGGENEGRGQGRASAHALPDTPLTDVEKDSHSPSRHRCRNLPRTSLPLRDGVHNTLRHTRSHRARPGCLNPAIADTGRTWRIILPRAAGGAWRVECHGGV